MPILVGLFAIPVFIILAMVGYGVYEYNHLIEKGKQEVLTQINQANTEARAKAEKGVSDVANCYENGSTWDRARGMCDNAGK